MGATHVPVLERSIYYAVAAARCGSFTAAAERVGVTQSAITKSIGDLEQRLGYPLFDRTARGIVLTEDGRAFIDRAARLLDDVNDLMKDSRRRDPYAGPLRVGVCPASLEWLLIKPISTVIRRHAQVRFDVSSSSFERMAQQLRNGAVDIAVGFEVAFAEQPDFKREQLAPLRTAYFVRAGHPLAGKAAVDHGSLAMFEFVVPSVSQPYAADIRVIFESQGLEAASRIHTVDYFPLVERLVSNSDAIGVVSLGYAASPAFATRYALIDLVQPIPPSPLCCARRARWDPPPPVRAFIQACREALPREAH